MIREKVTPENGTDALRGWIQRAWSGLAEEPAPWRRRAFEKTVFAALLLLVAVTWKVWTPQHVFPQVPLLGFAREWPVWLEWAAGGVLIAALVVGLLAVRETAARIAIVLAACAMIVLAVVDQLRLQAWAWQFLLIALAWTVLPSRSAWGWLRLLTVSIYFFSGVSKFNAEFQSTLGPRFVEHGLALFGGSMAAWPAWLRTVTVLLLPLGELLVAIGLAWPRGRRWGMPSAVLLHAVLIVLLGPWGMKHSAGVLVWNLFFMMQAILLFGPWTAESEAQASPFTGWGHWAGLACQVALGLACLLPALEPWGLWDTWPSWGLYSARNQRTEVYVHEFDVPLLSGPIRRLVIEDSPDADGYVRLRTDSWCLDSLGVPLTPQHRVQLGIALGVAERFPLEHPMRVVQVGAASYLAGRREPVELEGEALSQAAGGYWFNARPRGNLERRFRE